MPDAFTRSAWAPVDPGVIDAVDAFDSRATRGWASLLEWFYARAGLELPCLQQLRPEQVPQPYRSLLVHSTDMTPTLQGFFGQRLGLRLLSRDFQGDSYRREVVLTVGREERPVLYGVIRILLGHLPERARGRVLEERSPLGHILHSEDIPHLSWPQDFFRVRPDRHMADLLEAGSAPELYGRRNVLVDGSRRLLAEVIELLRPIDRFNQPSAQRPLLTGH